MCEKFQRHFKLPLHDFFWVQASAQFEALPIYQSLPLVSEQTGSIILSPSQSALKKVDPWWVHQPPGLAQTAPETPEKRLPKCEKIRVG